MPLPNDREFMQKMLVDQNKQLLDANKMLHAFLCAVLRHYHKGSVVLKAELVEQDFNLYQVKWTPVFEGHFELKAEAVPAIPKKD